MEWEVPAVPLDPIALINESRKPDEVKEAEHRAELRRADEPVDVNNTQPPDGTGG